MVNINQKLSTLLADTPNARALRAKFRKVKNLPLSEASDVWSFVYSTEEDMRPYEERALYTTLVIASIDAQKNSIRFSPENTITLGDALRNVSYSQVNRDAFADKMSRLVDSADYDTFSRRLISLLRQGNPSGNYYANLYNSLIGMQSLNKEVTLQRLAKTYYRKTTEEK